MLREVDRVIDELRDRQMPLCVHHHLQWIDRLQRRSGEARLRSRGDPLQPSSDPNQGLCGGDCEPTDFTHVSLLFVRANWRLVGQRSATVRAIGIVPMSLRRRIGIVCIAPR